MANVGKINLSYDSMTDYPKECIPNKLVKPSGKARDLSYESIDDRVYEHGAHMIAFKVPIGKMRAWIKALSIEIFDNLGNQSEYNVRWYDEPQDWTEKATGKRSICIDVSKASDTSLMYKVTFFITTGILQVQGNCKNHFIDKIFPKLKNLVAEIMEYNKDIIENKNEGDNLEHDSQTMVKELVEIEEGHDDELSSNNDIEQDAEVIKLCEATEIKDNNNNHTQIKKVSQNGRVVPVGKSENNLATLNSAVATFSKEDKFLETMTKIESHFTEAIDKIFEQQNKNVEKLQEVFNQQLKSSNDKFNEVLNRYEKATTSLTNVEKENTMLKAEIKNLQYSSNLEKEVLKSENQVKCSQLKQKHEMQSQTLTQLHNETERKTEEITNKMSQIDALQVECSNLKKTIQLKDEEILSLKIHNSRDDTSEFQEVTHGHSSTQRRINPDRERPPHVTLIGTSNFNHIDPSKLSSQYSANKITAYTLQETESQIRNLETIPNVIVLHSLTNDLKTKSPQECVNKMGELVQTIQDLYNNTKIVISLPTPRSDNKSLNNNASIISAMLKDKFQDETNTVSLCDNSNLAYKGEPIEKYFDNRDGVHLNQNGVSLLAANIRDSIDRVLNLPSRRKTHNVYSRGTGYRGYRYRGRRPYRGSYRGGRGGGPY